ncbi:MAG TPA: hypothetical protein VKV40_22180 [Ktedonobacteraceae bacterium]|nr:hypothetical protein [Ktedonobacteraceae bacterium]
MIIEQKPEGSAKLPVHSRAAALQHLNVRPLPPRHRYALQNSFNVPAVKVLLKTGVVASLHTAQAMGITCYEVTPNYTMVLGTLSVHLLDMTSAYGVFADEGVRVPPHSIEVARDASGHVVYPFVAMGKRVMSPQVSFLVTNVLSDNNSRTFEFGKCSMLYLYSTSQDQCYAGDPASCARQPSKPAPRRISAITGRLATRPTM